MEKSATFLESFGRAFSKARGVKRQSLLSPVATGETFFLAFLFAKLFLWALWSPKKKRVENFYAVLRKTPGEGFPSAPRTRGAFTLSCAFFEQ